MPTYTLTRPHNLSQLHDELRAAGIVPLAVEGPSLGARVKDPKAAGGYRTLPPDPPNTVRVTVPAGVTIQAVQAVVQGHTPRNVPPPPSRNKQLADALEALKDKPTVSGADLVEIVALLRQ